MDGKVGVVFGGAGGIGQAMVKMLLQNGCKVVFADICEETGADQEAELLTLFPMRVKFSKCDVTIHEDIERVFNLAQQLFGRPTICINSAGISNEREWRKVFRLNLEGAFDITQTGFAAMSKEGGGHGGVMIHLSSMAGICPWGSVPSYSSSKAGIVGFVRSFGTADHLSVHGVRIHALCPGTTETDFKFLQYDAGRLVTEKPLPILEILSTEMWNNVTVTLQKPEAVAEAAKGLIEDGEKNGQVVAVIGGQTYVEEEARAAFYQPLLFH